MERSWVASFKKMKQSIVFFKKSSMTTESYRCNIKPLPYQDHPRPSFYHAAVDDQRRQRVRWVTCCCELALKWSHKSLINARQSGDSKYLGYLRRRGNFQIFATCRPEYRRWELGTHFPARSSHARVVTLQSALSCLLPDLLLPHSVDYGKPKTCVYRRPYQSFTLLSQKTYKLRLKQGGYNDSFMK